MKKILFSIIAAAMVAVVPVNLNASWFRLFSYPVSKDSERAYFVSPTSDGGFIVTGAYEFCYPWLLKVNGNGDTLWSKIEDAKWGYLCCTQETEDKGLISTGGLDGGLWLTKMDSLGNTLWQRDFDPTDETDLGRYVEQTSDGGYIVVGDKYYDAFGLGNVWLVKTDSLGDTLWTRDYGEEYGPNLMDRGICVRQTGDGGYIISAYTYTYDASNPYDPVLWLIKTDSLGDTLWTKVFDESGFSWYYMIGDYYGYNIELASDGGFFISGATNDYHVDVLLLKTDSIGELEWSRIYGGDKRDMALCGRQTTDGGYIISAVTASFGPHAQNFWLLRTDEYGDTLWTRVIDIGESSLDYCSCMCLTSDGDYVITGTTDLRQGWNYQDLFLMRTDSLGSIDSEVSPWTVYEPDDGGDYLSMNPQADWLNCSTVEIDSFYIHCEIVNLDTQEETYHDSILISETLESFGMIYPEFAEWSAPAISDYQATFYATDAGNDTLPSRPIVVNFRWTGIQEQPSFEPSMRLTSTVGTRITLRYTNHPQGFHAAIFDATGRKVDELHVPLPSGTISWGRGFGQGVYFIRDMSSASGTVHKVVLTK